ncbi:MAG: type II toxin-antitoxin system VapC family toxin [Oscillospiraceae bacterium]|nr:type II toxin-antitoxin system VapC family toxin [Oscillospiraceae bacterium]
MRYLLDTNICIYAQKGVRSVCEQIKRNMDEGIAISVITLAELEYGLGKSQHYARSRLALEKFLSPFEILPFDATAAARYGKICADLSMSGTRIGTMDMLIAAHAYSRGLTVITHNVKEFERVQGLEIIDWYDTQV